MWPDRNSVWSLLSGPSLLILLCALSSCGRSGYEDPSSSNSSSAAADAGPGDADSGTEGGNDTVDLKCEAEELLTTVTHTFDSSLGPAPDQLLLALTLGLENSADRIGQDMGYSDGYAGTQDFRPETIPYFADIAVPLMDGTATDIWRGLQVYPDGAGGRSPVTPSPSLAGTTISMVRQKVESLELGIKMSNGAMQATGSVVWELWGCP